jgi:hypothetical protein
MLIGAGLRGIVPMDESGRRDWGHGGFVARLLCQWDRPFGFAAGAAGPGQVLSVATGSFASMGPVPDRTMASRGMAPRYQQLVACPRADADAVLDGRRPLAIDPG